MICEKCGAETVADRVSFWWMHDNHTFTKLVGGLDEIVNQANSLAQVSRYGMLCSAIVLAGDKELRRVGCKNGGRFSGGSVPQETWPAYLDNWIASVRNDPDIQRLVNCQITEAA